MISLNRIYEFALAYRKFHVYLWFIGIGAIIFGLANSNPFFLLIVFFASIMLYFLQQAQIGWTHDKVHNLLIYKQMTKQAFTPLEQALIDKYFGNQQRKDLIIEEGTKRKMIRIIYVVDIGAIALLIIGILFILGY